MSFSMTTFNSSYPNPLVFDDGFFVRRGSFDYFFRNNKTTSNNMIAIRIRSVPDGLEKFSWNAWVKGIMKNTRRLLWPDPR